MIKIHLVIIMMLLTHRISKDLKIWWTTPISLLYSTAFIFRILQWRFVVFDQILADEDKLIIFIDFLDIHNFMICQFFDQETIRMAIMLWVKWKFVNQEIYERGTSFKKSLVQHHQISIIWRKPNWNSDPLLLLEQWLQAMLNCVLIQ